MPRSDDRDRAVERLLRPQHSRAAVPPPSSPCVDAELLAAWSEGALPAARAADVERHLTQCDDCQAMAAAFARAVPPQPATGGVGVVDRWKLRWLAPLAAAAAALALWVAVPGPHSSSDTSGAPSTQIEMAQSSAQLEMTPSSPAEERPVSQPAAAPAARDAADESRLRGVAPGAAIDATTSSARRDEQASNARPAEQTTVTGGRPAERTTMDQRAAADALKNEASKRGQLGSREVGSGFAPEAVPSEMRAQAVQRVERADTRAARTIPPASVPPAQEPVPTPGAAPPPARKAAETHASRPAEQTDKLDASAERMQTSSLSSISSADGAARGPTSAEERASAQAELYRAAEREAQLRQRAATGAQSASAPGARATLANATQWASSDGAVRWRITPGGVVERAGRGVGSWEPVQTSGAILSGAAPRAEVCWLVGRDGVVLRATDGRRFVRAAFTAQVDLVAVRAIDERSATVTAADGRTFTTADGGATWTIP